MASIDAIPCASAAYEGFSPGLPCKIFSRLQNPAGVSFICLGEATLFLQVPTSNNVPTDLLSIAILARRSLQPGMPQDADGRALSAGTCLHAAMVVVLLLHRYAPGWTAAVRGGGGPGGGVATGVLDARGRLQGHYWIEATAPDGAAFVVDVTADQFDHPAVVVLPMLDAANRYRPGLQREVDEAFSELVREYGCADLFAAYDACARRRR